ncbi:MAG: helix-turn-helix domain-containing protein [Hoeflea sp.]|uniref:helix-turn-helix transcriptional regulator n=1 Tax=Hoeflea sp. TaxID=1940281 RepID=UPI0032EB485C
MTDLLTKAELAKLLRVTERTIDRQAGNPVFPRRFRVAGRAIRYRRDEVMAFLSQTTDQRVSA